ncbi:hypothetical protein C2869_22210 (plasmid) [Saccharobesus litoralis]|uniref:Adenine nucleotide alpha hydrolase n=1 Tax=Saccharobesus litoralis TaxID=2172099 RepID=A0A2S0VYE9_9ALTE|nr:hypothetical protein [Saccharobesus litoralis]AWB69218.1 hypothetical protein C2869_22210 [Saccharobesus litoralis]
MNTSDKIERLVAHLGTFPKMTIAVSGGIDSMVLSFIAHLYYPKSTTACHAHSPAVPQQAMKRIFDYTGRYEWNLKLVDAGEFADNNYLKNPINRCYYCKSNLYKRLSVANSGVVMSGTNTDDLSDFRPGLQAAEQQKVVHPYVDVGISKQDIYAIAKHLGLFDLQTLPSQPCLASRVETGIGILPADLKFIDKVESAVNAILESRHDVRCRMTYQGVILEMAPLPEGAIMADIQAVTKALCQRSGNLFSGIRLYQRGSAFVGKEAYREAV